MLLLFSATAGAQVAPDIAKGSTRAEVIQLYGWPKGKSTSEDREIWAYEAFDVSFQDGRVVSVTPRRATTLLTPRILPPRVPSTTPSPHSSARTLSTVTPAPSSDRHLEPYRPQITPRSLTTTTQAAETDIWYWARLLAPFGIAACILGIGAVVIAERRRVEREAAARRSVIPDPPKKTWQESVAEQLRRVNALQPSPTAAVPALGELSYELLNRLEWKRIELLTALYFRATGVRAECTRVGADGGVDVHLYRVGEISPFGYVQCKAWIGDVGVKTVRELYGVMAADKIAEGYFVTTGRFTDDAIAFAKGRMTLIDGSEFVERINRLPVEVRTKLLQEITDGDYTTPTCPNCDIKLVLRESDASPFWGCSRYPRCRYTMPARKQVVA